MFDEKRSWITKYVPFSVFLLMIRYKMNKKYASVKKTVFEFLTSHRFIMGTLWGLHTVLKLARQHSSAT